MTSAVDFNHRSLTASWAKNWTKQLISTQNDSTPSAVNFNRRSLTNDFTRPALEPSQRRSLHAFRSFSMAPTKTMKKRVPSKSKATQAKGKESAASIAALQATKKSKAAKAKGKEDAASTAALQKKNGPRKDSRLGSSYHGLNNSSTAIFRHLFLRPGSCTALVNENAPEASGARSRWTTAAASAAEEIEQLKGQFLLLRRTVCIKAHTWNWQRRFREGKCRWSCPCSARRDHCNLKTER